MTRRAKVRASKTLCPSPLKIPLTVLKNISLGGGRGGGQPYYVGVDLKPSLIIFEVVSDGSRWWALELEPTHLGHRCHDDLTTQDEIRKEVRDG